jgi:carboxyl-terminal processing protease
MPLLLVIFEKKFQYTMKRFVFIALAVVLALSGCKKSNVNTADQDARDALYTIMNQWYFWYDKMPTVTKGDYDNPADLLEAMRYTTYDKWSFTEDYDTFVSEMSGGFVGHGIRVGLDSDKNARIVSIYSGSDMYSQGVRRGWIIKTINGTELAPILIAEDATAYNNLMGASTAGLQNTFVFVKPDNTEVTIVSTKQSFTVNTVLAADTLHLSSGITGYLAFDAFYSSSKTELSTAFAYFSSCGATDVIVDLRYNTGGYLDVAQLLASYLAGNSFTTKTFIKYEFNDLQATKYNSTDKFTTTSYPMNLSRVVFITSRSTASASEVVISSLKPYIDITLVGDTTYGKPCGMNVFDYNKEYVFAPITFEYTNANNYGEFYKGMAVDVIATDDITHDFGNRNEACLAAAINYLEGGTKGKADVESIRQPKIFREGKKANNNLFLNTPERVGM